MRMFSNLQKQFNTLCTPSQFYLVLSIFAVILMLIQNKDNTNKYCVGNYSCNLPFSNIFLFIVKLLMILFWTIVLDSLCKNGYTNLAWVVVLFPFILMALMIGMTLLYFMAKKV